MLESTKEKYRKNAHGFAKKYLTGKPYSDKLLLDSLVLAAPDYTAKSFANMKAILAFFMHEKNKHELAFKIKHIENPAVRDGCTKRKRLKKKTINKKDMELIATTIINKKDEPMKMAFTLALYCGVRPGEMHSIQQTGHNTFFINGIKKDEQGKRGTDRHIVVQSKSISKQISTAIKEIKSDKIRNIQGRFNYLTKKLFPKSKARTTLYSLRHQFASELKSSKMDVHEVAYLLGHQSTRTMESYGYANAGSGNVKIRANISLTEIKEIVRDTQTDRTAKREVRFLYLRKSEAAMHSHPIN